MSSTEIMIKLSKCGQKTLFIKFMNVAGTFVNPNGMIVKSTRLYRL